MPTISRRTPRGGAFDLLRVARMKHAGGMPLGGTVTFLRRRRHLTSLRLTDDPLAQRGIYRRAAGGFQHLLFEPDIAGEVNRGGVNRTNSPISSILATGYQLCLGDRKRDRPDGGRSPRRSLGTDDLARDMLREHCLFESARTLGLVGRLSAAAITRGIC